MYINVALMVLLYVYLNRTPTLQPGSSNPWMSGLVQFLVMGVTKLSFYVYFFLPLSQSCFRSFTVK